MKFKKKHYICIIGAAVLLLLVFGGKQIAENRLKATSVKDLQTVSKEEGTFRTVTESEVRLENEKMQFLMDVNTTHFTVKDKSTGKEYCSVPNIELQNENNALYSSEIAVDYYDSNSKLVTMYSSDNSVAFQKYEVKASDDAVRVYYDIRESKEDIFVPAAFTQKTFEEDIMGKLNAGQKRRIIRYYKLCTAENNPDLVSSYPELNKQDLYIVIDSMNAADNLEVTGYFKAVGYTQEDYERDTQDMEISNVDIDLPAQFLVPVEYKLTENGFTVNVLADEITSESTENVLVEVNVLPMFHCVTEESDGYFLVPDGSGGLIHFKESANASYSKKIYGSDGAIDLQLSSEINQRTVMPVFGANCVDSGFFAIIEDAAESATVRCQTYGTGKLASAIYSGFSLREFDRTDIAEYSGSLSMNLYAKKTLSENPCVRYILLDEKTCDYSSMAKLYQEYLVEQGILTETLEQGMPLYVDFTGYITEKSSVLGISYDKDVVLSQVQDIDEFVDLLEENGISSIGLRIKSYSHGGMTNEIMDSFAVNKKVGTVKEIQDLSEKLREQGGLLYLDDVVDAVYKDAAFDSFGETTHASKKLNQMMVKRGDFDIVSGSTKSSLGQKYLSISPVYYKSLIEAFSQSAEKKVGDISNYGYSWSGYGSRLESDFSKSHVVDRVQARKLKEEAIQTVSGWQEVMTEGGNLYSVAQADTILNMPLSGSSDRVVTESVPFYQMVLHGYKNFAGAALNMAADSETEWLKTVESGASLYYSCMTEDYTLIKKMDYRQTTYPTSTELCQQEIINKYQSYGELFTKLATQKIVKHEITDEGLHVTTYEDGTAVAVNYEEYAIPWENGTVEARNFAVLQ